MLIPTLIIATIIYLLSGCHSQEPSVTGSYTIENEDKSDSDFSVNRENEQSESSATDDISDDIYIDVGGAVVTPKVVRLKAGSRVFEAIDAAGGVSKTGVTKYINMAAVCEDGEKIYIPTESEISQDDKNQVITSSAGYTGELGSGAGISGGKVNINTADSEELQTLNGIGPSMAARIIQYRDDNGKFGSVDDLLNVSGIGEKTLAKFAADVCV